MAAIEFVALVPIMLLVAVMVFQVGLAAWAMTSADKAARSAARAASMGRNPYAAAQASLPGNLQATAVTPLGSPGGHAYRVTVRIPKVTPLDLGSVHREAVMPEVGP